jgi:uncharacterized protein involved in exopolysaccharide biosynthesis
MDLTVPFRRVWTKRWLVLAAAVAAGAVGVGFLYVLSADFVCRSVILVEQVEPGKVTVAREERAITTDTFAYFFTNEHTLREVLEKTRLPSRSSIGTVRALKSRISVRTGRNTSLIELTVFMPKPDLALEVSKALIDSATRLNQEVTDRNVSQSTQNIKDQLERLKTEADERDRVYLAHQVQARIETSIQRFGQAEIERRTLREDLSRSLANMVEKEQEYKVLLAAANLQPATKVLAQTVSSDPTILESLKALYPNLSAMELLPLHMRSEIENVLSNKIEGMIVDATTAYEGSRGRAEELKRLLGELENETMALERKYHQDLTRSVRLQKERDASHEALAQMIQTYARFASESSWEQQRLRLLAAPVEPDEPTRPNSILVAGGSAFLGLVAAALVVLLKSR